MSEVTKKILEAVRNGKDDDTVGLVKEAIA